MDASDAKVADGVMNVYTATESPVPLERAGSGTESSTIHNGYIIPCGFVFFICVVFV